MVRIIPTPHNMYVLFGVEITDALDVRWTMQSMLIHNISFAECQTVLKLDLVNSGG